MQHGHADKKDALHLIVKNPLGQHVLEVIKTAGGEARFVGGIVRDALAGIAPQDWPDIDMAMTCLLYTSPSPRDLSTSRMPSSA